MNKKDNTSKEEISYENRKSYLEKIKLYIKLLKYLNKKVEKEEIKNKYYKYYTLEPISELNTNPLLVHLSNTLRPTIYKYGIGSLLNVLMLYFNTLVEIEDEQFYNYFRLYFTSNDNSKLYMLGLSHNDILQEIKKLEIKYRCNSEEIASRIIFSIINNDSKKLKDSLKNISKINLDCLCETSHMDAVCNYLKNNKRMNLFLMNYDLGNIMYIAYPYIFKISDEEIDTLISEYIKINNIVKERVLARILVKKC